MSKQSGLEDEAWSPREKVEMWLGLNATDHRMKPTAEALEQLRVSIVAAECRPDPVTDDWRF